MVQNPHCKGMDILPGHIANTREIPGQLRICAPSRILSHLLCFLKASWIIPKKMPDHRLESVLFR